MRSILVLLKSRYNLLTHVLANRGRRVTHQQVFLGLLPVREKVFEGFLSALGISSSVGEDFEEAALKIEAD